MCGLCGNYNGISNDDFTGRNQINYSTAVDFANSWQRNPETCGLPRKSNTIPLGCATTDFKAQFQIDDKCQTLKSYIITSQCKTIEDITVYHSQCLDKLCNCGDLQICYCQLALQLSKACQPIAKNFNFERDIMSSCKFS